MEIYAQIGSGSWEESKTKISGPYIFFQNMYDSDTF